MIARRILLTFALVAGPHFGAAQESQPAAFASFALASEPVLNDPHDLAIGPDGQLYIADKFGGRIVIMDPETLEVTGEFGDGALPGVHDISFDREGRAWIAVTGMNAVVRYDLSNGTPVEDGAIGPFPRTEGALAHSNGRLYAMASGIGQLYAVDGEDLIASAGSMPGAHDVAEDHDGTIWVADNFNRRLVQFTPELELIKVLDDPVFGFAGPRYLDIDDHGRLIVADQDAHRILSIDPVSGELLGVLGDGLPGKGPNKFDDPEGVAVRGTEYFFADSDNNRIVKYVVVVN